MTVAAYQHDTKRQLQPVPSEMYSRNNPKPPLSMKLLDRNNNQIGLMEFIPWQDGSVIRLYGPIPLAELLAGLLPEKGGIVIPSPDSQLSSVLKVSEEDFRKWPEILANNSNIKGVLEESSAATAS